MSRQELAKKFAEMCNYGLDRCPSSITLSLVRNAIAIASSVSPEWFIEEVGPFFYDKRKEIVADDVAFFINRSWSEQYVAWGFMGKALAESFEGTIKGTISRMRVTDNEALTTVSNSLLRMYCRYLQVCQTENATK